MFTLTGQLIQNPTGLVDEPEYIRRHFEEAKLVFDQFGLAKGIDQKMLAISADIYNTAYPAVAFQPFPNGEVPDWSGAAVWQKLINSKSVWFLEIPIQGEEKKALFYYFEQECYLLIIWPWGTVVPMSLE